MVAWFKKHLSGVLVDGGIQFAFTYILPALGPAVTVALGYLAGIPWVWIWVTALASFAFISNGLLRFDEWRERRRIENRITFSQVLVGRYIHDQRGIILGFRVGSDATFPIEFEIVKITTRLGDKVPAKRAFDGATTFTIPPKGHGWFYDNAIMIETPPRPGTLEGFIEFEAAYGRQKKKYRITGKKQVIVAFNNEGLHVGSSWHDAN